MDQWHRVAVGCAWVGAHSCSTHAHIRMRPWTFEEELSTRWDGVLLNCPGGAGEAVPGVCGCGHMLCYSPEKAGEA